MENFNKKASVSYDQDSINWQALAYFNYYRILLSGLFLLLVYIGRLPQPLGSLDEELFSIACHSYLLIAIVFSYFIRCEFPRFNLQVAFHVLIDIIMLSLLMYSSNGLSSGFGLLIAIAVAGGSLLRVGKIAILFAAIATFFVLGHEVYLQFFEFYYSVNYTHAGILGATFFIIAIIGNLLATKVKETEALAELQAIEINELAKLNEHIVQRMLSGIMVLDRDMNILLINKSAKHLIGQHGESTNKASYFISFYIKEHLDVWLQNSDKQNIIIKFDEGEVELQVSFIKLTLESSYQVLIFIENFSRVKQRAQHLKLASLGRLTASIAHEVRNPLGAINHASQLLCESESLTVEDLRLTEIINDHSLRINNIIENVLSISRREKTTSEEFALIPWLIKFIDEFATGCELPKNCVRLEENKNDIFVRMDPSQLYQVLWNLCENAKRYSRGIPIVTLLCDVGDDSQRPYIDIIDYGMGISNEIKEQLFEPFFTTETKGSGLGLYLARELCEANQATLILHTTSTKGTIFRVSFMPINKSEELE